jgi:hypothetical protein
MNLPLASSYKRAMLDALAIQTVCGILCLLLLDGGNAAALCFATLIGFWLGVLLVVSRRPSDPRPVELALVRFGFLPMLVIGFVVMEAFLQ